MTKSFNRVIECWPALAVKSMEPERHVSDVTMSKNCPGFFEGTEMPTAGWWDALWPDPAGVVAEAGIKPGMDVIDLCSGDGWFTLPIAMVADHVLAIDIDPNMLNVARRRLAENGVRFRGRRCLRPRCAGRGAGRFRLHGQCLSRRS